MDDIINNQLFLIGVFLLAVSLALFHGYHGFRKGDEDNFDSIFKALFHRVLFVVIIVWLVVSVWSYASATYSDTVQLVNKPDF